MKGAYVYVDSEWDWHKLCIILENAGFDDYTDPNELPIAESVVVVYAVPGSVCHFKYANELIPVLQNLEFDAIEDVDNWYKCDNIDSFLTYAQTLITNINKYNNAHKQS